MSNLKEQIEVDIKRFFEQIENQDASSQIQTLRNLIDKYVHLSTANYMMDSHDLSSIVSDAKARFARDSAVIYIKSGSISRRVQQDELANLFVIEAAIAHLNKKDCLKRMPKFDKRDK